jgi:hypothetical protein
LRRSAEERKPGRIIGTAESFQAQPSSHQIRLPQESEYKLIDADRKITDINISAARNDAGVKVLIDGPLKSALTNDATPSTAFIPGLSGLAEEETILAIPVMHRKASSGEGGSALRQVLLQISGSNDGTGSNYIELEELSKWVGKVLPGVRFWVKFDRLRDKNIDVRFMTPDMKVAGQGDQVAWKAIEMAGTGFLQVVQIFAYLLYFKPKLLLVDEPDAHLHPTRQQALIRALSEATVNFPQTQILVSTHAPALVRALPNNANINWISDGLVRAQGDLVREKMGWSALDKEIIIFTEDGNLKYFESLGSSFKCNTQRPQGIGCCDGQTIQAPQRRGTRRDFGRASARGEPWGDRGIAGAQRLDDRAGTGAWPSGGRARPAVLPAAWRGPIPGAAQAVRTAAQAGQGWVAS